MSLKNPEKALKFLKSLKSPSDPPFNEGQPYDIIIPIMGPTGVGKSTFINALLEQGQAKAVVGHGLQSSTSHLNPVIIPFGQGGNGFTNPRADNKGRLVLIDTPGFDDTFIDDAEILRRISVWLNARYASNMKLGGVIYLQDIMQTRMLGTTRRNLDIFRRLVGEDALRCVVLGTTKWNLVGPAVGSKREEQYKSQFWKDMIDAGSQVISIRGQDTPRTIVNSILERVKTKNSKVEFLMIQSELTQLRKFVPETEAGQTLKHSVDELIKLQKRKVENLTDKEFEKGRQELDQLLKTAKELKVPLGARIKRFFL